MCSQEAVSFGGGFLQQTIRLAVLLASHGCERTPPKSSH